MFKLFGFEIGKKKNLESPLRGKRSEMNILDDYAGDEFHKVMKHKDLREKNNFITLGEIKYRKVDFVCWQCEQTGVTYSDNVMNIITEDFEKNFNIMAIYE